MFAKLKTAWLGFNHWRLSAFPFRLTVLLILLVFACDLPWRVITPNHSPLINELVWIACKAIRYSYEPRVPSAYLHYYRARENQRLQNELRTRGGLQFSPDELAAVNASPTKVDNKLLFDIGKRHGIISAGVSQREYMRTLWAASLSMTAMEFDKGWDEVKHDVFNTGKLFEGQRDWYRGVELFIYVLSTIMPIPLTTTVPWFVVCLTLVFIAVRNPASKRQWALAIALPVLLTLLWTGRHLINIFNEPHSPYSDYFVMIRLTYITYYSILAVIAGILGIRLRRRALERANTDKVLTSLLFITGTLLMFQFIYHPFLLMHYYGQQAAYPLFFSGNIFCNISFYAMLLLFCLSGAAMTGYAVKSYLQMQAAGRFNRLYISPELLCYLCWGIAAIWACHLLLMVDHYAFKSLLTGFDTLSAQISGQMLRESKSCTGQDVIMTGMRITVFIGNILIGLLLFNPYPKQYFRTINICAIVLIRWGLIPRPSGSPKLPSRLYRVWVQQRKCWSSAGRNPDTSRALPRGSSFSAIFVILACFVSCGLDSFFSPYQKNIISTRIFEGSDF